jgi:hypothetical protein
MKIERILLIIARTIDYKIGLKDSDAPELPILTFQEALVSFSFRFFIFMLEFTTCLFVIANIIRHW